jgi:hypothetical protein
MVTAPADRPMLEKKKAADAARRRQSWQVASREETKNEKDRT